MIIIVFYSYIFPLYIYTLLFWQRKKNKKVGTIFLFSKLFLEICWCVMWNDWHLLYECFWMIFWLSLSAQAKTKKRSLLFVHDVTMPRSSVKNHILHWVGRIETQFWAPPIYHLRFHCGYNKPPVNTVLNWFETTIKAYQMCTM